MKIKLTLEYDGRHFVGWQEQTNGKSVQQAVSSALRVYLNSLSKKRGADQVFDAPPTLSASGRTDSGVHALGQVASFEWPDVIPFDSEAAEIALNGILPKEISLRDASSVEDSFDARLTKHRKQYSYYFVLRRSSEGYFSGRTWKISDTVAIAEMCKAARHFVGTKDFASFRAADCVAPSTIRTIHVCELSRESEDLLRLVVQGNGFLKQMIRIIAGTLHAVGKGSIRVEDISAIFQARDRGRAGETAPAHGLVLDWVNYDPAFRFRNSEEGDVI